MALGTVPQNSGIYKGMGSYKILTHFYEIVPTLSGSYSCHYSLTCVCSYIVNLHVKLVSSHLESIKLQMLIKIKTNYYHGPLNNPLIVIPDVSGPFIIPFQQEVVTT
jgi:hypothetical protein